MRSGVGSEETKSMTDTPETDARLAPEVVETLVANHRAFLGFLEKRLGDRALAEDILQDAFVRGVTRGETLRDERSAVAWFYQMLRNAVIDHHRRAATKHRRLEALAGELEALEPAAMNEALRDIVCACVGALAETLKPEYADAIKRIEIDGVSVKDYAESIGISSSNAGVRVFRAREALRKQVTRACGTCADHGCLDCTCKARAR